MHENWNTLVRELARYGVKVENAKYCLFYYEGKLVRSKIATKIKHISKNLRENFVIFKALWKTASDTLDRCDPLESSSAEPIDHRVKNIFLHAITGLSFLGELLTETCPELHNHFVMESQILSKIKAASRKDSKFFSKETMQTVADCKITIDYTFRLGSIMAYVIRLLTLAQLGPDDLHKARIKVARGVSGPWANLDLPRKERQFEWSEIKEEVHGRDKDIRKQKRYRQGLENYNNDGRVGEGYYWRELRNEPYSWDSRSDSSPYQNRSILSK